MKKVLTKVLFLAAALLVLSCSNDDNEVKDSKAKKVAVLLPDASVIDRWALVLHSHLL